MYDVIIIGAGTAGFSAYKQAVKQTQNILIINAGAWDTTCARVGCMPSKVLISAANRAHEAQHLQPVGLTADVSIHTKQVMPHVRSLRDRFTRSTVKQVDQWPDAHKISGHAQFVSADTVQVNGQRYSAKAFVLAVGSTPNFNSDWQNILGERLISTDQFFELEQLPQSIAVIGSGVIALELAQAVSRLGVKTDMFTRSQRIASLTSPTLQDQAQQIFAKALNIYWKTLPESVQRDKNRDHRQAVLHFQHAGQAHQQSYDYVLQATGRQSNLHTLQLHMVDAAFTDIEHLAIHPVTAQLGDYPIYVVGDAHSQRPVQHEAAFAGKQVVKNALQDAQQSVYMATPLSIVFSEPQMAIVGASYAQLNQANRAIVTGFVDYAQQGRALVLGNAEGGIEVYVDAQTGQLLGAELLTHDAEHLAHLLAWMVDEQLNIHDILDKPFYHPTLQEGIRTALKHARRQMNR